MSESTQPVRLRKAATELNVGISTIVDFLAKKGFVVEASPNAKIEPDAYAILLKEFSSEKQVKDKAMLSNLSAQKDKKESVTIEKPKIVEKKIEPEIVATIIPTTPVIATAIAEQPAIKTKAESDVTLSLVGKIDLDKINQKTRPDKKTDKKEEAKPEQTIEIEKPEPPAQTSPVVEVVEQKLEVLPTEVLKPEIETIFAKAEKLSGVVVVGKMILLPERPRKPVASSSDSELANRKKKKRKRIEKAPEPGKPAVAPSQPGNINSNNNNRGNSNNNTAKPRSNQPFVRTPKPEVTEADIQKEIKDTLARLSGGGGKSKAAKFRKAKREAFADKQEEQFQRDEAQKSVLKLTEFVTVSDLSNMMKIGVNEVISACLSLGIFASINQRLDAETISVVAEEFGYKVEFISAEVQESIKVDEDKPEDLVFRAPIVTVMGHVDHGKTSLLDYIRKENVIAGEAGGITQHIGAYSVDVAVDKKITFLDTPGHEAFTAMRARGAKVTDIAIIVVAADDNVMPQTREAINHAQAANIPMIFAINKIDKDGAAPEKIKEELANMNILVEDWGGKYQCQEISAKKGINVDALLEKVLLEAELLDLKANPNKNAIGTIIESSLDKGRGYVSTLLVEAGSLKVGDAILAGQYSGKIKAMYNERGTPVTKVGPSMPVSVLGLNGAPNAGDKFNVMDDEREARTIALKRQQLQREQGVRAQKHITLDEIGRRIAIGDFKELNVIIKGDVDGSIEALTDSLQKLSTDKIQVNIIHKAVGQITENDVLLASASDAIIIGFQVRPSGAARKLAEKEQIEIKMYSIIYAAIEEVKDAMEGMLSARIEEKILGSAEIREVFKITKVGTIAGCMVLDGKITRNNKVRVIRDGIVVYTGVLESLKRFKDDAKEVLKGYDCGLNIEKFNDIKEGDTIESFEEVEVKQTL
jgi:translation initiation factor IF-2